VDYLKLAIEDRKAERVTSAAKPIGALKPAAALSASAGHALLAANFYEAARDLLQQAVIADPRASGVELDLAIATFHAAGANAALLLMDRLPESERSSDYYLARAQMLDASGKVADAVSALDRARHADRKRPEVYRQAVALLVNRGQAADALRTIEEGVRNLPEDREILFLKATTLEFARRGEEAAHVLDEVRNRWPEWSIAWTAQGIILASHEHYAEARQALETAITLGASSPEAYYFLADCTLRSGAAGKDTAETLIQKALKDWPADPWIQALAGRIALERGEYQAAVDRERAALRLKPALSEAHSSLARAYTALGRKQDAAAELEKAKAIQPAEDALPYLSRLFQGRLLEEEPFPDLTR
jgi:predicted Zn-dependent protease